MPISGFAGGSSDDPPGACRPAPAVQFSYRRGAGALHGIPVPPAAALSGIISASCVRIAAAGMAVPDLRRLRRGYSPGLSGRVHLGISAVAVAPAPEGRRPFPAFLAWMRQDLPQVDPARTHFI